MNALLEATGIIVVRGGRALLRGVDLVVAAGEVVGVLGPSGAGKTTLFGAITGDIAYAGHVTLDGQRIDGDPLWRRARRGIGYMPQGSSVLCDLTVRQNLRAFSQIAGVALAIADAAQRVDLGDRLDVRAGDLSAGERRRLDFARAITLLSLPLRLLVCDEPFAGVDPKGAERIGNLLRGLAQMGVAVLLADHHVGEALRICTRAVLLVDGSVQMQGSPDAFRAHPQVRGRYLPLDMPP